MPHDAFAKARRADMVLVGNGTFASRAQAQAAIAAGRVSADGEIVRRAAQRIAEGAVLRAEAAHPYASRGGLKLAAALRSFGIDPTGLHCLDVGASTGGFTDVMLAFGAAHVTAVDVGRDQMIARLRGDVRVTLLERTDARSLTPAAVGAVRPQLVAVDVSFIALGKVLPHVLPLAAAGARLVALVKPQFEVGRRNVGKGGIVRDASLQETCAADVLAAVERSGWHTIGQMRSPVDGGDGNREFLVAARRD